MISCGVPSLTLKRRLSPPVKLTGILDGAGIGHITKMMRLIRLPYSLSLAMYRIMNKWTLNNMCPTLRTLIL